MNRWALLLVLVLVLVGLASCSEPPGSGACILGPIAKCIQVRGDQGAINSQSMACTETGGTWSSDPCPEASLIGCCDFTLSGLEFRECYYTGTPTADPQGECAMERAGSVWTPAP